MDIFPSWNLCDFNDQLHTIKKPNYIQFSTSVYLITSRKRLNQRFQHRHNPSIETVPSKHFDRNFHTVDFFIQREGRPSSTGSSFLDRTLLRKEIHLVDIPSATQTDNKRRSSDGVFCILSTFSPFFEYFSDTYTSVLMCVCVTVTRHFRPANRLFAFDRWKYVPSNVAGKHARVATPRP